MPLFKINEMRKSIGTFFFPKGQQKHCRKIYVPILWMLVLNNTEFKPGEPVLDWSARKRVARGTARALEYLHEQCNPKIIHRDVKAANVLLDEAFEPVVGDFGLAKLVDVRITSVTTKVVWSGMKPVQIQNLNFNSKK